MKKILLSLLTLILFTGIFAQVEEPHVNLDSLRDEIINKSQYVFEGVIIKQSSYLYNNHTPVESNIIQILKVFRGNLKPGTVEIAAVQNKYSDFTPPLKRESELYSDSTKKLIFKFYFTIVSYTHYK